MRHCFSRQQNKDRGTQLAMRSRCPGERIQMYPLFHIQLLEVISHQRRLNPTSDTLFRMQAMIHVVQASIFCFLSSAGSTMGSWRVNRQELAVSSRLPRFLREPI